jgi:hypothetical protein
MAVVAVIGLVSTASAGTIKLSIDTANYTAYPGGEYAADILSGGSTLAPQGNNPMGDFQTFCVEYDEHFSTSGTYEFTLNDRTIYGGVSTADPLDNTYDGTVGSEDPLSFQTAYLYDQFWRGTLSNYDYTYGSGRVASAGALQDAIWWLEGEKLVAFSALGAQAQAWINEAVGAGWTDIGNVRVLNLWAVGHVGEAGYEKQDQLVMVPLPSAALAGFALLAGLGLAYGRRRRRPV